MAYAEREKWLGRGSSVTYLGETLHPEEGHPINPGADRLVLQDCRVGGTKMPTVDLHLKDGARVFYFHGPILVIEDDRGNVLERIAPIYVRL